MEIQIEKNDCELEETGIPKRRIQRSNPGISLIVRVLICCAIIDIPIWAYFHFVEKVPVLVGLLQIRDKIQTKINPPKPIQVAPKIQPQIIVKFPPHPTFISPKEQKIERKKRESYVIYSWIDEKGQKAFSNTGFPKNEKYTDGKIEWY